MTYQNLWDTEVFKGKYVTLNAYIKKDKNLKSMS